MAVHAKSAAAMHALWHASTVYAFGAGVPGASMACAPAPGSHEQNMRAWRVQLTTSGGDGGDGGDGGGGGDGSGDGSGGGGSIERDGGAVG